MTPHGKAHHVVHCLLTPLTGAAVRRWSPVEGRSCDNLMARGNRNCGNRLPEDSGCGFLPELDLRQRCWQRRTSAPRCARQREVQSTVLRGGVSCGANHSGEFARRQTSGRTNMSAKISALRTGEFPSATWPGSPRLERQNSSSQSAPAATRDHAGDGCAASARRPARSMPLWLTSSRGLSESPAPTGLQASGVCGPERVEFGASQFSSGDGLGIQQPGSNTWGGLFVPTAPSGRADESAMCPAVARSFEGRAA